MERWRAGKSGGGSGASCKEIARSDGGRGPRHAAAAPQGRRVGQPATEAACRRTSCCWVRADHHVLSVLSCVSVLSFLSLLCCGCDPRWRVAVKGFCAWVWCGLQTAAGGGCLACKMTQRGCVWGSPWVEEWTAD
eukprot:2899363-Rhodomonas_salina.2